MSEADAAYQQGYDRGYASREDDVRRLQAERDAAVKERDAAYELCRVVHLPNSIATEEWQNLLTERDTARAAVEQARWEEPGDARSGSCEACGAMTTYGLALGDGVVKWCCSRRCEAYLRVSAERGAQAAQLAEAYRWASEQLERWMRNPDCGSTQILERIAAGPAQPGKGE